MLMWPLLCNLAWPVHRLCVLWLCSCKKVLRCRAFPNSETGRAWEVDVSSPLVVSRAAHNISHVAHWLPCTLDSIGSLITDLSIDQRSLWRLQAILVSLQVVGLQGEILFVSQFTLYGRLKKPKPDYSKAMPPQQVQPLFWLADVPDTRLLSLLMALVFMMTQGETIYRLI